MPEWIAILEDNQDRLAEMSACLGEAMPKMQVLFFEDAYEMVTWLRQHLHEALLISLDHDLPLRETEGKLIDCGNGRLVAGFLASQTPTCPIIIHSSNESCAQAMYFELKEAGWPVRRVYPYDGEAWVRQSWMDEILRHLGDP